MNTYFNNIKTLGSDVKLYLVASGIFNFTLMNGIYPVLFNLYLLRLGYGTEFIGLVNAMGLLGYALSSFLAGSVGRRWGARRAMILGFSLALGVFGLQPLIEFTPRQWHQLWLLSSRPIGAFGIALVFVNMNPFLAKVPHKQERNMAYTLLSFVNTVTGFLGSLVGGILPGGLAAVLGQSVDHSNPYRYALILSALLCIPGVFVLSRIKERYVQPHTNESSPKRRSPMPVATVLLMSVVVMLRSAAIGTSRTFFNVYLDDQLGVSTAQIGALFSIVQATAAVGTLAIPLLAARLGNYKLVLGGALSMAISLLPIALIPHWLAATIGRLGVYTSALLTDPAINAYQMDTVAPRWRLLMSSATSTALGLSWSLFAFGGGYMIMAFSYRALFMSAAVLNILGAITFGLAFGRKNQVDSEDIYPSKSTGS